MMEQFVAGLVCNAFMACGPKVQPPQHQLQQGGVTIVQTNNQPNLNNLSYEQINSIGLDCNNKDYIFTVLENRVGKVAIQPETLSYENQKINSAARVKIWALRTYCKGNYHGHVVTNQGNLNTQALPERAEEQFESKTIKHSNGRVETQLKSTRVEEPGLEVKQVVLGQLVREQHLLPLPTKLPDLTYNNLQCRWFKDLAQYNVIACLVQNNVWQVVDKF